MSSRIQNIQNYIFNLILFFLSHFFILLSPLKKPNQQQQQNRFQLLCAPHILWRVTELPPEQVYIHPLVRSLLLPLILAEGFIQKLKPLWLPVKVLHALEANAEKLRLHSEALLTVCPTDFC